MVLDLLGLIGLPTTIAVVEGARHQKAEEQEEDEQHRMKDFHIEVYCNSNSRKKDQVHGTIVVLKDHKVRGSILYQSEPELLKVVYKSLT